MTDVLTSPVETTRDHDIVHIVCCEDEWLALCGETDLAYDFTDDDSLEECIVCADLVDNVEYCPKYDTCKRASECSTSIVPTT